MMKEVTEDIAIDEGIDPLAGSLNRLHLSSRTREALKNAGMRTIQDILTAEQEKRLMQVRNIGKACRKEIELALNERGISLDGSVLVVKSYSENPSTPTNKADNENPPVRDRETQAAPVAEAASPVEMSPQASATISFEQYQAVAQNNSALPKTAVFVDYEHWVFSLKELYQRKPNIDTWFSDLKKRGHLLEVTFFGDFSDDGGMKDELANIRIFSNRIIETKNPNEHHKKDFTDFIMLDNIYQKVFASPEIEQVVIFTGDGHFSSVASYLRNYCSKIVGVYGIDKAISKQLETVSDWCVRIPFVDEPCLDCRAAILKNLKYAEEHTISPTFLNTVRYVAEFYDFPEDLVTSELRLMLDEGVVQTFAERSRWDFTTMLNILKVNWELANASGA